MGNYSNTLYFETHEVNIYDKDSWLQIVDNGCEDIEELEKFFKEPFKNPIERIGSDEEIISFAMNEIIDYLDGAVKDIQYRYNYDLENDTVIHLTIAGIQ